MSSYRVPTTWTAWKDQVAVVEPGIGEMTYAALDSIVGEVATRLREMGIRDGDRVGIYVRRSADALVAMLGALRVGAAYVPVDPYAPPARNAAIHADCAVALSFVETASRDEYTTELRALGANVALAELSRIGGCGGIRAWLEAPATKLERAPSPSVREDLAFVLYTSGSTGKPKGCAIPHGTMEGFLAWCRDVLSPSPGRRFANHAKFHHAISLIDVYGALTHGATLVIVPDEAGRVASTTVDILERERINVWVSAPTILAHIAGSGVLPGRDLSELDAVAFGGSAFPLGRLNELRRQLPHVRYVHLYGCTETNLCTYDQLPVSAEPVESLPVGRPLAHHEVRLGDANGATVPRGAEGEILVRGPGVMSGYWGRPDLDREKFIDGWYRTGDIARELEDGRLLLLGRRDRMVKRHGYRVELDEIEARLYEAAEISEVAVVAFPTDEDMAIHAHVTLRSGKTISSLALKRFCGARLPAYMVPEKFHFHEALPRTSAGKVDYVRLRSLSSGA